MGAFVSMLGIKGIVAFIGIISFVFTYKYSVGIFDFVERQTLGTRVYILEKFEILFIDVKPEHVTYALLGLSVGLGMTILLLFGIMGKWLLGFFLGMITSFIGFKIPKPIVDYLVKKRIREYQNQMVDAMTLLANGIRAGLSLPQAIGMIVDEMPSPISEEFNVMLQQNRIGVQLEECFDNLAKRIPTLDNEMFVSAVNILRETGGNLAEVFDTIVDVIRERIRLQQKVETSTAQGKFQGLIIAAMPFAILLMISATDPKSIDQMFSHPVGIVLFIVACISDAIGTIIIFKIVNIEDE